MSALAHPPSPPPTGCHCSYLLLISLDSVAASSSAADPHRLNSCCNLLQVASRVCCVTNCKSVAESTAARCLAALSAWPVSGGRGTSLPTTTTTIRAKKHNRFGDWAMNEARRQLRAQLTITCMVCVCVRVLWCACVFVLATSMQIYSRTTTAITITAITALCVPLRHLVEC